MTTKMISVGLAVDEGPVPAPGGELVVIPRHTSRTLEVGVAVSPLPIAEIYGGTPPYTVLASPSSGILPAGVYVTSSANSVLLTGTPTAVGTATVQILLDVSDSTPATQADSAKGAWGTAATPAKKSTSTSWPVAPASAPAPAPAKK